MASNDIQFSQDDYGGSNPLYFVVYLVSTDQYVNSGISLETYSAGNWTLYATPLVLDTVGRVYQGSFPAGVPNGVYHVGIYQQMTSTPLPSDLLLAEGDFEQLIQPALFTSQLVLDAIAMVSDFGEKVTYLSNDNNGNLIESVDIWAVVNRSVPAVIQEDSKVLADSIEISVVNDAAHGRSVINPGRDKIIVTGRYGGVPKPHLVTLIQSGDAGMFNLRVK